MQESFMKYDATKLSVMQECRKVIVYTRINSDYILELRKDFW